MFRRNLIPVWVGLIALSGMFLLGQETWPPPPICVDNDGDGYGNPASVSCAHPQLDCDDGDADVNPGVLEGPYGDLLCIDGVDNDCDGLIDNNDPGCMSTSRLLPDTGITKCYDNEYEISCPASGQPFYGQDAQYETNPMSFAVSPDGLTIVDNVTGLMWQREDDNTTRTWANAISYCEGLTLGGYEDWRLPNEYQLQSIVDYGRYNPAIDTTAFPGTDPTYYWSSSTSASKTYCAWVVSFFYPHVVYDYKWSTYYVRCVRGEETLPSSFTDNLDGTVTDNATGLMWQQEDDNQERNWESALAYCEDRDLGGHVDWRLPDVKELRSIVDNTRYNPAIDPVAFPGTDPTDYWSSSTGDNDPGTATYAWGVGFNYGSYSDVDKTSTYYVRCVR